MSRRSASAAGEKWRQHMTLKHWCTAAAGSLVFGFVATSVQADPITKLPTDHQPAAAKPVVAAKTASRHCWLRNGLRHCAKSGAVRVYGYRKKGSTYVEQDP